MRKYILALVFILLGFYVTDTYILSDLKVNRIHDDDLSIVIIRKGACSTTNQESEYKDIILTDKEDLATFKEEISNIRYKGYKGYNLEYNNCDYSVIIDNDIKIDINNIKDTSININDNQRNDYYKLIDGNFDFLEKYDWEYK